VRRVVLLLGLCALAAPARADFVRVQGSRFVDGDRPFSFVGANAEVLHGEPFRREWGRTLDALASDGMRVVRIWALGEGPADAPDWSRKHDLFRAGPDGWIDDAYTQLDRVLAGARARGLRVIVTLGNHWSDYGGIPQYLRWAGLPERGPGARDRFFSDERARALYRDHLVRLVDRVNSITGVRYADDPTIFAWELLNESQVESDEGAAARQRWIAEMAGLVHARAPHHLVTPGVIGYGTRAERAEWIAVCRMPEVDYCDSHLYPQNADSVPSERELEQFIDDRVQLAQFVAKKPLVIGEFGFDTRPEHATWLGRGRTDWFGRFLERVRFDGAAGALVWIYQPWTGRARDFGIYVDRDDTADVRERLRTLARAALDASPTANPLLSAARGEQLLYDPYREARRPAPAVVVEARDHTRVLLDPTHFSMGRFERVGSYDGGPLAHAYGAGDGFFEWRFAVPAGRVAKATLAFRVSSEYPGQEGPPDGTTDFEVWLDGHRIARRTAAADDGVGTVHTITLDRAQLDRLPGRAHRLRLVVPPGERAHGLCVYGAPTGHGDAPAMQPIAFDLVRLAWQTRAQ
jgi:mannan endo-1,4-beta-mannosidase